jgi:acetate kinase
MLVLALNTGSTSLKFAVYDVSCTTVAEATALRYGTIDGLGGARSRVRIGTHGA